MNANRNITGHALFIVSLVSQFKDDKFECVAYRSFDDCCVAAQRVTRDLLTRDSNNYRTRLTASE